MIQIFRGQWRQEVTWRSLPFKYLQPGNVQIWCRSPCYACNWIRSFKVNNRSH